MKNILFVCIENSNRSQMAEAFAKVYGGKNIAAFSAGSRPSGKVNPRAIAAMKNIGYDLSVHRSKSTEEFRSMSFDYVITMGCGDECPFIPAKHREDWNIADPKNAGAEEFARIRDGIGEKVKQLINKISSE